MAVHDPGAATRTVVAEYHLFPSESHELKEPVRLSVNDLVQPLAYTRTLLFYPLGEGGVRDKKWGAFGERLKLAAQQLVDNVPSLGGRLDTAEGVIMPHSSNDGLGGGVRVVLQDVSGWSLTTCQSRGFPAADMVAVLTHPSHIPTSDDPLFSLFASRVDGGVVIGGVGHHKVMDGMGHFDILRAVSETCRGVEEGVGLMTDLHHDTCLLDRSGEEPTEDHPEYIIVAKPMAAPPPAPSISTSSTTELLPGATADIPRPFIPPLMAGYTNVPRDAVNALKTAAGCRTLLSPPSTPLRGKKYVPPASATILSRLSTHDIVAALFWRAIVRARGLSADLQTRLGFPLNGRTRLWPQIPRGYIGNVTQWCMCALTVSELTSLPLKDVACMIRRATESITDARIRSSYNFIASVADKSTIQPSFEPFLSAHVAVPNWSRFPIYDLDFGFGSSVAVRRPLAPMDGLVTILPPEKEEDAVVVLVGLKEEHWAAFVDDKELAECGIVVGPGGRV